MFFPESFNFKQQITPDEKIGKLRMLRWVGFSTHITVLLSNFLVRGENSIFVYYTTWGVVMTLLNFGFSFISTFLNEDSSAKICYHKFCYVFFEATWTSEAVITIFFWCVLVWLIPPINWTFELVFVIIILHIYPFLMLTLDLCITKMLFRKSHVLFTMIPPILYMFLSIYLSHVHNLVVYEVVLTWKDYITIYSAASLVALFVGISIAGHYIGKKIFKRTEDEEDEKRSPLEDQKI